jgi:hypothetical protein
MHQSFGSQKPGVHVARIETLWRDSRCMPSLHKKDGGECASVLVLYGLRDGWLDRSSALRAFRCTIVPHVQLYRTV